MTLYCGAGASWPSPSRPCAAHDADAVRSLAPRALVDCSANGFATEVALCNASLAWLAWQDGRRDDVVTRAIEATDLSRLVGTFSYLKWLGLFPLIAVHLTAARVSEATCSSARDT